MSTSPKGSHFCSLPETRAEAFDAAASFLKTGLDGGNRCVYVADAHPLYEVRSELPLHALCLYDRTRFSETVLEEAANEAHPKRWLACEALGQLE